MDYYPAIKRNEHMIYSTTWMNLKIMCERSQTNRRTYCMTPFVQNSRKYKLIYGDRKQISVVWGRRAGRGGNDGFQRCLRKLLEVMGMITSCCG